MIDPELFSPFRLFAKAGETRVRGDEKGEAESASPGDIQSSLT